MRPHWTEPHPPEAGTADPVGRVEALLADIGRVSARLAAVEARLQAEVEAVRARYQSRGELKYHLEVLDRELKSRLKTETAEIFQGRDKVVVRGGILYHGRETRLSIPRTALKVLKDKGWNEGLRISESLNRGVIESWPEERLSIIGARRRLVDKFAYDILRRK